MPQIIARIRLPRAARGGEWGAAIDQELLKLWVERSNVTPPMARALYRVVTDKVRKKEALPAPGDVLILDEILIAQALTLGWRIMTSQLFLFRCSRWSEELFDPEMFERLGKALARSVRILSRKELPPIDDPGLRDQKKRAVPELRALLRRMRRSFSHTSSLPTTEDLITWFMKSRTGLKACPTLRMNALHWFMFLLGPEQSEVLKTQLTGRLSPSAVFDTWLAWCKGHEPDYLRKRLTRVRPQK
jgi:hypothetical protein